jgi:hypothetical protein
MISYKIYDTYFDTRQEVLSEILQLPLSYLDLTCSPRSSIPLPVLSDSPDRAAYCGIRGLHLWSSTCLQTEEFSMQQVHMLYFWTLSTVLFLFKI